MLAFSQIISAGQNPMAIAEEMEKQIKKPPPKPLGLSEDEAVAAFAEFMSGGGQIKDDPSKILAEKMKKEEQEKAAQELQSLQQNDATAAFAGLVDSQVIQQKAQLYEGSGTVSTQEALQQSTLQKFTQNNKKQVDALAMVQQQSEEELQQVNKLVENTDTAKQAIESGLIIPSNTQKLIKKQSLIQIKKTNSKPIKSKIQSAIEKLESGYSVEDVRKYQLKQKSNIKSVSKITKVPTKTDLMISQQTEEDQMLQQKQSTQSQKDQDAQVDAQAEEILNQIKSAAVGIKGIGGNGGIDDQQLKAALGGMNLLQLASDIKIDFINNDNSKFDSNAKEALDFLSERFPEDYPEDHIEPIKIQPSQSQLTEKKIQEDLEYSKKVAQDANDYNESLLKINEEQKEQDKIKEMFNEYNLDKENIAKKYQKLNLAQVSQSINEKDNDINNSNFDENAQLALEFMSQQFPKDYPQDQIPAPKKEPSEQELAEQEKKKMLDYSKQVAEQATEYNQKLIKEQEEKEEREKLKRMGMEGEPINVQLEMKRNKQLSISLAQIDQKTSTDQLDILAALKNGKQISEADIANLKDEDLDALNQNLNQLDLQEGSITTENSNEVQKVATKQKQQTSESAQVQNQEEMKQYSESIVQAADIVTSESDVDKSKGDYDDTSFFDLKKQAIEAAKAEKQQQQIQISLKPAQQIQTKNKQSQIQINNKQIQKQQYLADTNDHELEAKAAIVAQTEAANQAAIEESSTFQQNQLQKQIQPTQNLKIIQQKVLNQVGQETESNEYTKIQQKQKFEADKQSALDQGFSQDQAERYALEEQYQNKIQQAVIPDANQLISDNQSPQQPLLNAEKNSEVESQDNKKQVQIKQNTPMTKPMTGPSGSPPTQKDDDKHAAQKIQEKSQEIVQPQELNQQSGNQLNDLTIQEQINIAQNQQEQIKAALEKKKQENLNKEQSIKQKEDLQKKAEEEALAEATAQYEAQEQLKNEQNQQQQKQSSQTVQQQEITQMTYMTPQKQVVEQEQQKQQSSLQKQQIQLIHKPIVNISNPEEQIVVQKQKKTNQKITAQQTVQSAQIVNNQKSGSKYEQQQNLTLKSFELKNIQQQNLPEKVTEKQTIQQTSEINKHVPKEIKQNIIKKQKQRAKQYEQDLNKARDEIKIAQKEMKNIDSEVVNFHQKMAKSMHSLLQAFTEGFEAMDKAKKEEEEEDEEESSDIELTQRRMDKFNKIHSGINNLEALTSQLKQSINDDAPAQENIQIEQALVSQKNEVKQIIPQNQSNILQQQVKQNKSISKIQNKMKSPQLNTYKVILQQKNISQNKQNIVQRNIIKTKILNAQKNNIKNKMQLIQKNSIKQALNQKNEKLIKKISPKNNVQKKYLQKQKAQIQNIQINKYQAIQKPVKLNEQVISKIQKPLTHQTIKKAIINGKIINNLQKQAIQINKKPIKLVQVDSEQYLLGSINAEEKLKSLLETREKLRHISKAIGNNRKALPETIENLAKSFDFKRDQKMKKDAQKEANELIAHSIAQRMLSQVQNKNSQEIQDLRINDNSLKHTHKSLSNKNIEDTELMQVGEEIKLKQKSQDDDYNDEIYIFEKQEDQSASDTQLEEKQLQEAAEIREAADQKFREKDQQIQDSNSQY